MLELRRGRCARVQTEMVEFIAMLFPSSKKKTYNLVISRRSRAGTATKCTKKCDARAKLLFCQLNLVLFDVAVAVAVTVTVAVAVVVS